MGFFNFLYKLTNIFSNKRKLKVFIVLAIILFLLFSWSRGVFASSDDNYIMNYQLNLQRQLISYLRHWYTEKYNYNSNTFFNICNSLKWMSVYVVTPTGDPNTELWVYFYTPNSTSFQNSPQNFTIDGTWSVGFNSGTEYDVKLGDMTSRAFLKISIGNPLNFTFNEGVDSFLMPSSCYMVRSIDIDNFLIDFGYSVNPNLPTTYHTNDEELQSITSSGFNAINSTIQTQTNQMTNSINSATNTITNSVDSLTNTITDTSTDDTQVQFAQDNNQDLTNGFFSSLFNSFQTAFTNGAIVGVEFNIPFTNRSFTFSNRYVRTLVEQNTQFQPIVVLATAFWWFALGYYVILDIYKKINAIKSGDLTNIENENITTDLM